MAQKGYTPRIPDPEKALTKFENREDMDLNEFSDLLEKKFSYTLTVKAIKTQLGIIADQSEDTFNIDNYRISKHRKIVLPYELYSVLLPIVHFGCTNQHDTFDVARLIKHYDELSDYIFNKMDKENQEYLIMIPALRNFHDSRELILDNFEELSQLNSLMLRILPQTGSPLLNHINENIRSLRRRCYIANLRNQLLVDSYFNYPRFVAQILNTIRKNDNLEQSKFPGIEQILKCLTTTDIDEILIHYFIYKNIVTSHPEKDRVTPDELFRLNFAGLYPMNYYPDICVSNDKDALARYDSIKKKASKVFDLNDPIETFLYDQLRFTAKYLLFTKTKSADTEKMNKKISQEAKALYNDAIKTMPENIEPEEDIKDVIARFCTF